MQPVKNDGVTASWLISMFSCVMANLRRILSQLRNLALKGNSGLSTSWAQMKEHEKSKRTSHH